MATHETRCPVDATFDPLSAAYLDDPFVVMAALPLAEAQVFFAPAIGYYVVTRYADIEQVFSDPATYSAAAAQAPLVPLVPEAQQILLAGGHKPQPSMVSLDEPAHARLRRPAARAFAVKRVNDLVPTIRRVAVELLDAVEPPEFDLVRALAFPLPATIVFSLMGVPEADHPQLKRWCGYRAALGWGRPAPEEQVEIATHMAAYRAYLRELVAAKAGARGDDLTSDLLAIHDEDPERLTRDEIASILFSLSFAGHETTTGLIGNAVRRLLEDRGRWDAIVADSALIAPAIDETLRFDPSVPVWRRVTTRAATLAGVELPAGAKLFLWLAAANRDPAVFPAPERFDLHRPNADQHLAFGKGLHYCLGAHLGKLETRIALEELVQRFPKLTLVPGQQLAFHPNISFRGPQQLRVRCDDTIPTSVDFHDRAHARQWTDETPRKRPWRTSFFAEFCAALRGTQLRILELGSGPGHLAREILTRCDVAEYVALDFSDAMHELAREHLGELAARVAFVTRDFRTADWTAGLSGFDAVVTMQAVHETRHKRRALPLLTQARTILRPGGQLLYCDHYFEDGKKVGLMLDRAEQPEVLRAAGYAQLTLLRDEGGMALYAARE